MQHAPSRIPAEISQQIVTLVENMFEAHYEARLRSLIDRLAPGLSDQERLELAHATSLLAYDWVHRSIELSLQLGVEAYRHMIEIAADNN